MLTTHFFADPELVGLLRYWDAARAGRALPEWRGDVGALPPDLLPNLIVADFRGEPTYRYMGVECARLWGGNPTGRRIFTDVLRGAQGRYLRSLADEMFARRAPVFSAAVYQASSVGVVMTGRVMTPFTWNGSAEPCFLLTVQLFKGLEPDLRAISVSGGAVHELRRDLITDAAELCARLEAARRQYQIARHTHRRALAQDLDLIVQELAGRALVSLPCIDDAEPIAGA
jgi:hypothetical protein